jgi:hypothetical protein
LQSQIIIHSAGFCGKSIKGQLIRPSHLHLHRLCNVYCWTTKMAVVARKSNTTQILLWDPDSGRFWLACPLPVGKAAGALISQLGEQRSQDLTASNRPNEFPFVRRESLQTALGVDPPALRQRVRRLNKAGRKTGIGGQLAEGKHWRGYRLSTCIRFLRIRIPWRHD